MSMMRSARSAMLGPQLRQGNSARNLDARATWLCTRERFDPLHGCGAAHREPLVEQHVVVLPAELVRGELAQHACRDARGERARGNACFRLDERKRSDHRVL